MRTAVEEALLRTTLPVTTSFSGHVLFNITGQAIASSTDEPGLRMSLVSKATPPPLKLIVLPVPVWQT